MLSHSESDNLQSFALNLCPVLCFFPNVNGCSHHLDCVINRDKLQYYLGCIYCLKNKSKKIKHVKLMKLEWSLTSLKVILTSTDLLNSRLISIYVALGICFLRSLYVSGLIKFYFPLSKKSEAHIPLSNKPHREIILI